MEAGVGPWLEESREEFRGIVMVFAGLGRIVLPGAGGGPGLVAGIRTFTVGDLT